MLFAKHEAPDQQLALRTYGRVITLPPGPTRVYFNVVESNPWLEQINFVSDLPPTFPFCFKL